MPLKCAICTFNNIKNKQLILNNYIIVRACMVCCTVYTDFYVSKRMREMDDYHVIIYIA